MRPAAAARLAARPPPALPGPAPDKSRAPGRARPRCAREEVSNPRSEDRGPRAVSSMACGAARAGLDVVLLFERAAGGELIALRLPGHAGDLLARPQEP